MSKFSLLTDFIEKLCESVCSSRRNLEGVIDKLPWRFNELSSFITEARESIEMVDATPGLETEMSGQIHSLAAELNYSRKKPEVINVLTIYKITT